MTQRYKNCLNKGNHLIIIFALISVFCFGQETPDMKENLPKEKNISYSFITEYGLYMKQLSGGFTGVFVNGICFNKTQDLVGMGIGLEYGIGSGLSFPIFVNYRHYFSKREKIYPLINVSVGTRLTSCYGTELWHSDFYSVIAAGFRAKSFSFTSGLFTKSLTLDNDGKNIIFLSGFEIKLGYTFNANKK